MLRLARGTARGTLQLVMHHVRAKRRKNFFRNRNIHVPIIKKRACHKQGKRGLHLLSADNHADTRAVHILPCAKFCVQYSVFQTARYDAVMLSCHYDTPSSHQDRTHSDTRTQHDMQLFCGYFPFKDCCACNGVPFAQTHNAHTLSDTT